MDFQVTFSAVLARVWRRRPHFAGAQVPFFNQALNLATLLPHWPLPPSSAPPPPWLTEPGNKREWRPSAEAKDNHFFPPFVYFRSPPPPAALHHNISEFVVLTLSREGGGRVREGLVESDILFGS